MTQSINMRRLRKTFPIHGEQALAIFHNRYRPSLVRFRLSRSRKRKSALRSWSIRKARALEEVASFPVLTTRQAMPEPERELTAGELFDGNISRLGRVEHDL